MRIDYRDGKTYIDQVPYLEKILKRFGMPRLLKLLFPPAIKLNRLMELPQQLSGLSINW